MAREYAEEGLRKGEDQQKRKEKEEREQVKIDNWVERKDQITQMKTRRDREMADKRQNRIDDIFDKNEAQMVKQ